MRLHTSIATATVALFACSFALDARSDVNPRTELVHEVNVARATARTCGDKQLAAAPALTRKKPVDLVAETHTRLMAAQGALTHAGKDGTNVMTRLTAAGYSPKIAIDLIAGGTGTAKATVAAWLAEPAKCAVIMDPQFVDVGAGYAENATSQLKNYWTLVVAAPK